jgi:hypothetical protein
VRSQPWFLNSSFGRDDGEADGVVLTDEVLKTVVLLRYSPNRSNIVCDRLREVCSIMRHIIAVGEYDDNAEKNRSTWCSILVVAQIATSCSLSACQNEIS